MSHLKSAPSNLCNCKILQKNKNAWNWNQKCFIWVFLCYNFKNYCHIWNQHPQICQNDSLTHTVNIGIGSAFSKDLGSAFSKTPGSAFSEDPSPGPGPLYKVCLSKWKDFGDTYKLFFQIFFQLMVLRIYLTECEKSGNLKLLNFVMLLVQFIGFK